MTNLSDNGANNYTPQISGSNVVWRGNADGNDDIYVAYWLGPDAVLNNVDLSGQDLSDIDFSNADLTDANLTGADLSNAILAGAILEGTPLSGATVTAAQILTASSIAGANVSGFDFSGASFSGQDLSGTQFDSATLIGTDFSNTDLRTTSFTSADLSGANLDQSQLPAALPSLPVTSGAVVSVVDTLDVTGSVQVDTGGILSVSSDSFTATGVNMQGGRLVAATFGLDLDEIGDVSGHGQLFGHVELGTDGTIAGSGSGLELFGHVSGSGTLPGTTLFGNLNIGSSPGAITLEDMTLSASGTTTFEVAGTDASQFDRLTLVGSVALNGTAQISFDSFTPDLSDTFQLIDLTNGTASSWFSSVVAPEGWTLSTDGLLAIPEPSSALLLGIGILCVAGYRRDSLV